MVPSLDAIAEGTSVAGLTRSELAAILVACTVVQGRIAAALIARSESIAVSVAPDKLWDAREAAARLGVAPAWLCRRSHQLPFAVRLGGHVRFSERKLSRFISNRAGTEAERAR